MKQRFVVLAAVVLGFCVASMQRAEASTFARLVLDSEVGDYIGGGVHSDVTYTPANTLFFNASILTGLDVALQPAFLRFSFYLSESPHEYATLDFATNRLGVPFATGTYTNAERASFASAGHAGLDVTFQHRGSNTLTGSFTVNSVSFFTDAGDVKIGGLDVNFEQHSEGATPALFGHFTYSSGVSPVPEPETYAMLLAGLGLLGFAARRRKQKQAAAA